MKDRDVVVATNQLASDMRADETRSADNQNAHAQIQATGLSTAATERTRRQGKCSYFLRQFMRDYLIPAAKRSSANGCEAQIDRCGRVVALLKVNAVAENHRAVERAAGRFGDRLELRAFSFS
jgi:hypothetical protein